MAKENDTLSTYRRLLPKTSDRLKNFLEKRKIYAARIHKKNRKKILARQKKYHAVNRDKILERQRINHQKRNGYSGELLEARVIHLKISMELRNGESRNQKRQNTAK